MLGFWVLRVSGLGSYTLPPLRIPNLMSSIFYTRLGILYTGQSTEIYSRIQVFGLWDFGFGGEKGGGVVGAAARVARVIS